MFGNGSSPRRDYSKDPRAGSLRSSGDSPRKDSPTSKSPSFEDSPHLTPSQRFAGTSTFALPSPPLPSLPSDRSINSIDKQLSSSNQQRLSQPVVPRSSSHNSSASPISPALPPPPFSSDAPDRNSPGKVVVLNYDRARRGISSEVGRSPSVGDIVVQAKDGEGRYRADRKVLKSTRRPSPAPPSDAEPPTNRTPIKSIPQVMQGRQDDFVDLAIDSDKNASRYPTAGGLPSTPPPAIPRRRIHQDDLQSSSGNLSYPQQQQQQQQQQFRQKSNSFSSPLQRPIPESPAFYATGKEMSVDHLAELAAGNLNGGVGFSGGMGGGKEEVDWRSVLVGYQHQRANASSAPPLLSSPLSKQSYSGNARDASLSMGSSMLPQTIVGDVGGGRRSEDAEIGFGRVSQESDRSSRSVARGSNGDRRAGSPVRRGGSPEKFSQRDSQMLSSPLAIHARSELPQHFVPSHPLPTPPAPSPAPTLPAPPPSTVAFSPAMLLVEESRNNGLLPTPPNSDLSHSPDLGTPVDAGRSTVESQLRSPLALKPGPLPPTAKVVDGPKIEPTPSMTPRMSLEDTRPVVTNEKKSQPRLSIDTSTLPQQFVPPSIAVESQQPQETSRPSRSAPPSRIPPIIPRIETPVAKIEFALSIFPETILVSLLRHINLKTLQSLRKVSKTLARCLEVDAKEFVLQRFLGAYGYRSYATGDAAYSPATLRRKNASSSSAEGREVVITSRLKQDLVVLDLRDLDAFFIGLRYSIDEFYKFAQAHSNPNSPPLPVNTLCMIRASTRAWNRVVLRIRAQYIGGDDGEVLARLKMGYAFEGMRLEKGQVPICKVGRAPVLRVWVPTKGGGTWLSDEELVECEREVWRSGVWNQMNRGDVVWNIALGDFANNGKTIFDGRFLRDLEYSFDFVGHLPSWLDMLSFSPSTYHNLITSSGNPVFYLSLSTFLSQIRETLTLCQDKIAIASPQGEYIVKRFVYRSSIKLRSGTICGSEGGKGFGPGGVEVVHDDWVGFLILETDGTTEHATSLIARCSNPQPTPYRILREKSRAGKIWLTPVAESERIN